MDPLYSLVLLQSVDPLQKLELCPSGLPDCCGLATVSKAGAGKAKAPMAPAGPIQLNFYTLLCKILGPRGAKAAVRNHSTTGSGERIY